MRPLNDDIVAFIRARFRDEDEKTVLQILDNHAVSTPRVQRSVLFLSGGSLSMLKHYVNVASTDVREVILRAEYVLDVAEHPMPVRKMSEPFEQSAAPMSPRRAGPHPAPRSRDIGAPRFTPQLAHRRFSLGKVAYVVSARQFSDLQVRCYRHCGHTVSIVTLPLVFVMERLSERIELQELGSSLQSSE